MEGDPSFAKVTCYGEELYTRCWLPPDGQELRANLLISHGLGEHCLCYCRLAQVFTSNGIAVYAHDHYGHGRSAGTIGLVLSTEDIVRPLASHAAQIRSARPEAPLFLLGHSMGGLAAVLCAGLDRQPFAGVLLLAPALAPNPEMLPAWKEALGRMAGRLCPQWIVPGTELKVEAMTSDAEAQRELLEDPLQFNSGVRAATGVALIDAMRSLESFSAEFPFLLLHSEADQITYFPGSERFFQLAASEDKEFVRFRDIGHQPHNEVQPYRSQTEEAMVSWILRRC